MYIYIHINIHIYTYVYIHKYISDVYTCINIYTYTYICIYIYIHTQTHIYTYTYTHECICIRKNKYANVYTYLKFCWNTFSSNGANILIILRQGLNIQVMRHIFLVFGKLFVLTIQPVWTYICKLFSKKMFTVPTKFVFFS